MDILPPSRYAKELIIHAGDHLKIGNSLDLKLALIHSDNSIEVLLKGYLRYHKNLPDEKVSKTGFFNLITECGDINVINKSKSYFLAYHDIRNSLYHMGTLSPDKQDVISSLELAKLLFNELNPNNQYIDPQISMISGDGIKIINKVIGNPPYLKGLVIEKEVAKIFSDHGFLVKNGYIPSIGMHADFIAQKNNKIIICELKYRIMNIRDSINQMQQYIDTFKNATSRRDVEGWIIYNTKTSSHKFSLYKVPHIKILNYDEIKGQIKDY